LEVKTVVSRSNRVIAVQVLACSLASLIGGLGVMFSLHSSNYPNALAFALATAVAAPIIWLLGSIARTLALRLEGDQRVVQLQSDDLQVDEDSLSGSHRHQVRNGRYQGRENEFAAPR
jgi:ABC-type siderophore export system fused ATPase/permease subunit